MVCSVDFFHNQPTGSYRYGSLNNTGMRCLDQIATNGRTSKAGTVFSANHDARVHGASTIRSAQTKMRGNRWEARAPYAGRPHSKIRSKRKISRTHHIAYQRRRSNTDGDGRRRRPTMRLSHHHTHNKNTNNTHYTDNNGLNDDGARNCWNSARERNRRNARSAIRHRVQSASVWEEDGMGIHNNATAGVAIQQQQQQQTTACGNTNDMDATPSSSCSIRKNTPTPPPTTRIQTIQCVLQRIVVGDRSFFSLQAMTDQYRLWNEPFPVHCLWEQQQGNVDEGAATATATGSTTIATSMTTSNSTDCPVSKVGSVVGSREDNETTSSSSPSSVLLLGEAKLICWCGEAHVERLKQYIVSARETCTLLEYAVWVQRYHILGQLLLGGMNPCVRYSELGIVAADNNNHSMVTDSKQQHQLVQDRQVGALVQKRFFSGAMPLSLSSYIVKRVVDLRRFSWEESKRSGSSKENEMRSEACGVCDQFTPLRSLLCFDNESCCRHSFCEPCLWKDILQYMELRIDNVVLCPVCSQWSEENKKKMEDDKNTNSNYLRYEFQLSDPCDTCCPIRRKQESLTMYRDLPADARAIKLSTRKAKVSERDMLCSTWSKAVKTSIGKTQSVRMEKFLGFVERGSFHFVKGCLDAGMDVDARNEYGQTALFLSVWLQDFNMVQLLLHYGCDPGIPCHGGIFCHTVAKHNGLIKIADALKSSFSFTKREVYKIPLLTNLLDISAPHDQSLCALTTLIPWSSDHDGAGSFIIDNALDDPKIDSLISLWTTLPTEPSKKKNSSLCSIRSYFCDALGWLTAALRHAVLRVLNEDVTLQSFPLVDVYPHMRFLSYATSGVVLAPHVDLSRTEAISGRTSTHSFLLYLTHCEIGGETALLGAICGEKRHQTIAAIKPRRGRLLLFPHLCPHEGLAVVDAPKLLIRGEVWLHVPNKYT